MQLREPQAEADRERDGKFVELLAMTAQKRLELAEAAMRLQVAHRMAALRKQIARCGEPAGAGIRRCDARIPGVSAERSPPQRKAWERAVRDEVGDGEIRFVADAGDHGNERRRNRARNDLFVECPQIFERAAAASEDQHVREFDAIEIAQGRRDVARPLRRPARERDKSCT